MRLDPISEKDLVAALLTRDGGVVRAVVKGARGKSKRAAALQLLTEVSITTFQREGQDLARLESLEILRSSFELASRAESAMLLPYISESVQTFVPESEPGGDVYRLTRHVLDALEGDVDAGVAARYFEVWLLRFAGLLPEDRECALCGRALLDLPDRSIRFDPAIPGFICAECQTHGAIPVSPETLALLNTIRRTRLTEWPTSRGRTPENLDGVENLAREVRRRFLGHELKSYRFLRSLG